MQKRQRNKKSEGPDPPRIPCAREEEGDTELTSPSRSWNPTEGDEARQTDVKRVGRPGRGATRRETTKINHRSGGNEGGGRERERGSGEQEGGRVVHVAGIYPAATSAAYIGPVGNNWRAAAL